MGSWRDEDFKKGFIDRVLKIVDEFAPGFSSSIIGMDALSPLDLERVCYFLSNPSKHFSKFSLLGFWTS